MTLHVRRPNLGGEYELGLQAASIAAPAGVYRDFAKRAFDLFVVILLALPVAIVVAVLALVISLDGASPFYRQVRYGRHGRNFTMWKLRSMVPDADAQLTAYLEEDRTARAEWDRDQKLTNDPRITWIGYIIRATSLDELPQLYNVWRGEMSIVGPRPIMESQLGLYRCSAYYTMRPGITGFWQVSARNEASFSQRANFDAFYHETMSFTTDLQIIWRTVGAVLRCTGR